jgi:FAD binding domain/Berberine and berberine like
MHGPVRGANTEIVALRQHFGGQLLQSGDPGYEQARKVWNGTVDRYPRLIARCTGVADVIDAVAFARQHELLVAVRCGGHSIAGKSVCDDGLMIDLSPMRGVHIDPVRRIARVEGGATLGRLDRESQVFGLATTSGVVTHTGVGGLTLGGGCGRLARKYGLSCDNLLSVDLVKADGQYVTASETENADLFWGLRGGGGNFGIATSFVFRLHDIGTQVVRAAATYPLAQAEKVLRFFREYAAAVPDEVTAGAALFIDEDGKPMVSMSACHIAPLDDAENVLRPLATFGMPKSTGIETLPYTRIQAEADAVFPHGQCYYWKSHFVSDLPDGAIACLIGQIEKAPGPKALLSFQQYGGAISRIGPTETAFGNRDAQFDFVPVGIWQDPSEAGAHRAWVRETWAAMAPFASRGVYLNNLGEDGAERIKDAVVPNYDRLVALKSKYDPTNFFRLNANIQPSVVE